VSVRQAGSPQSRGLPAPLGAARPLGPPRFTGLRDQFPHVLGRKLPQYLRMHDYLLAITARPTCDLSRAVINLGRGPLDADLAAHRPGCGHLHRPGACWVS
jgi:hypothetical protein